jgi:hypothetical protein
MDQPANQQRMAEASQQLDQTRSNIRQASDALQAGQTQQAAAAGARAEQQLDKLRDQFRKQAAGRFHDEMRAMREDARRLDKSQQQLAEQLAELEAPKPKSLRESSAREEVREGFEQQRSQLDDLMEQMRKTIEEAETSEPLLSKQLYDTVRQAHQQRPNEALDTARQLVERGFVKESRQFEAQASSGIGRIKQGVERAAESVLGDEGEAIRRAQEQVNQLAKAIDDEMRRATGNPAETGERRPAAASQAQQPRGAADKPGANSKQPANAETGQDSKPARQAGPKKPGQGGLTADGAEGRKEGQVGSNKPGSGGTGGQGAGGQSPPKAKGSEAADSQKTADSRQAAESQGAGGQGKQSGGGQRASGRGPGGGLLEMLGGAAPGGAASGPLTGEDFRPWAERLRDVEEMLDDPQLRAEAAKIRDRASAMRAEFKRHSQEPNWDLVRETISKPLAELRARLAEELLKRGSKEALVPLDRDPVPPNFSEQVRRYYERLGSGK